MIQQFGGRRGCLKKKQSIGLSLKYLIFLTFLLFSSLIFRLGFLQIVQGEKYRKETEKNSVRKISVEAPQGWIMDSFSYILQQNRGSLFISTNEVGIKDGETYFFKTIFKITKIDWEHHSQFKATSTFHSISCTIK